MASYYKLDSHDTVRPYACTTDLNETRHIGLGMFNRDEYVDWFWEEMERLPFTRGVLPNKDAIMDPDKGGGYTVPVIGLDLAKIHHVITLLRITNERPLFRMGQREKLLKKYKDPIEKYGIGYLFLLTDFMYCGSHSLWMFYLWGVEETIKLFLYPDKYYQQVEHKINSPNDVWWLRDKSYTILPCAYPEDEITASVTYCLYNPTEATLLKLLEEYSE